VVLQWSAEKQRRAAAGVVAPGHPLVCCPGATLVARIAMNSVLVTTSTVGGQGGHHHGPRLHL